MNKREMKQSLKWIKVEVQKGLNFSGDNDALSTVFKKLDELQDSLDELGIDIDIDIEEKKYEVLKFAVQEDENFINIVDMLNTLIEELEEWQEEVSERKSEEIGEYYLDPLREAKECFEDECSWEDTESIEFQFEALKDSIESLLAT